MRSLSSVGLGLSVVFTCLLLALIAEIYYLLWWKRRIISREIEDDYTNPARELFYMFCWKKPVSSSMDSRGEEFVETREQPEPEFQFQSHNLLKPFENGVGIDLITGPPRFLFTIKEETKEDLESQDGISREGKKSLSDLLKNMETPYLTPLSSPPFFTPPLTPMGSTHSSHSGGGGYNPLFESSTDVEFNRIKCSPPPKFKFLRDAEEKLLRKSMEIKETKKEANLSKDEEDGSFITIIVAKNNERDQPNHHYHSPQLHSSSSTSSSSQVLPLASSPSTLAPSNRKLQSFMTK